MICTYFCAKSNLGTNMWKFKTAFLISLKNYYAGHFNRQTICTLCRPISAGFHSSPRLRAKTFQETENEYAHSIMENIPSYSDTILKYPISVKDSSFPSAVMKHVREFSEVTKQARLNNLTLEERMYSTLVKSVVQTLPKLSDDDLIEILHDLCVWPPSPKSYSPNFKMLWNAIDSECVKRLKLWSLTRKLLVAEYWFILRLNRISQYNRALIQNLLENLNALSNYQVVQLMFYINLQRKVPQLHINVLEQKLISIINLISVEEIGIVCLGFFKSESIIYDFKIIKSILERFSKELGKVNTLTVVAILKFLRKSMQLSQTDFYIPLLHKCISYISKLDIPTSIQLALLSSACHVYHPLLLNRVTEKVTNEIEIARIKDCTKLLQCLAHFNHSPESKFHELYLLQLRRAYRLPEIKDHPRILAYSTLFNAYLGHYNYDILRTVLDPNFVKSCCKKCPEASNALVEIDYCVEIECKDYKGARLDKREWKRLETRRGNMPYDPEYQNVQTRLTKEVVETLKSLFKSSENILVKHILPHFFSPDVIVRLSKCTDSMTDLYGDIPSESILIPCKDENWASFVITAPFCYAYNSQHLTGNSAMKLRQLHKLGYKTVLIPYYELPRSELLRKKYIKEKLELLESYGAMSVEL